jgi:hypothetical protein
MVSLSRLKRRVGRAMIEGAVLTARLHREMGANTTRKEYEEHLLRIGVFKSWFFENVMASSGPLADSVMVLPYGVYEPSYSDIPYG